ncbi:TPA: hypothetical protein N0F65_004464 [Lagenidium giganteum]|uniref:Uncharacterized protein n=1 Tax=Lagenidium giganteum TaxID=4803 RepID=A0AAV2ZJ99_9STRA|nr:TPA: hypothetical protein N0F65_004464 [Lagenidium giganteum]
MTGPAAGTNPLVAVAQLQAVVDELAPVLQPQILPRGGNYGVDMLVELCKTDAQKQTLLQLVQQTRPSDATTKQRVPQLVARFDLDKKVYNIEKIQWMNEEESLVHELSRFVELQLRDRKQAMSVLELFLKANKHDAQSVEKAEQCFNAAFALQTLLRAFPRPPFAIAGEVIQISERTDVAQAFGALFGTKPSSKKQQKNKKNKKQADTSASSNDNSNGNNGQAAPKANKKKRKNNNQ